MSITLGIQELSRFHVSAAFSSNDGRISLSLKPAPESGTNTAQASAGLLIHFETVVEHGCSKLHVFTSYQAVENRHANGTTTAAHDSSLQSMHYSYFVVWVRHVTLQLCFVGDDPVIDRSENVPLPFMLAELGLSKASSTAFSPYKFLVSSIFSANTERWNVQLGAFQQSGGRFQSDLIKLPSTCGGSRNVMRMSVTSKLFLYVQTTYRFLQIHRQNLGAHTSHPLLRTTIFLSLRNPRPLCHQKTTVYCPSALLSLHSASQVSIPPSTVRDERQNFRRFLQTPYLRPGCNDPGAWTVCIPIAIGGS